MMEYIRFGRGLAETIGTDREQLQQLRMTSMDAFFIIIFQLDGFGICYAFSPTGCHDGRNSGFGRRIGLMFSNQSGWLILLGILVFAAGRNGKFTKIYRICG